MLDLTRIYTALGSAGEPEPPHEFTIGDLAQISFDDDGRAARLVLAAQSLAGTQAAEVAEIGQVALPLYISVSPAGRICYHLVADSDDDQTDVLIGTLNALVTELTARHG
ncbi:MAG: hypothetical protein OXC81_01850 [Betaproteobacteria bacterium]|nr:hypothetical protein [Betaproteobacteria bacterium]